MRIFLSVFCLLATLSHGYAAQVILNEYNAVGGTKQLDEGLGKDTFFGLIDGNGGNWFELLVIEDVDMRGWQLDWAEDEVIEGSEETTAGSIMIGNADIWSSIRAGSIITFIESNNADGQGSFDTSTDTSYDPSADDWWINISTQEEQAKGDAALVTTTTNDGLAGDFSVGSDAWTLSILNAQDEIVFGPVGEGADWPGGNVNSEEGGSLEGPIGTDEAPLTLDVWKAITPTTLFYDDTGSTSFGAANADYDDIDEVFVTIQDLSALRGGMVDPVLKSGDFDGDGSLTVADLDALTAATSDPAADEKFDVNSDGAVNDDDRTAWVGQIRKTWFGDANLDGEFNSSDFVLVFQANEFEDSIAGNSTWATGDWNGDGDFTTSDFVLAFQTGGFELGPRAAVSSVPEPSVIVLLLGIALVAPRLHRPQVA